MGVRNGGSQGGETTREKGEGEVWIVALIPCRD